MSAVPSPEPMPDEPYGQPPSLRLPSFATQNLPDGVRVDLIFVTPEQAKQWLEVNQNPRKMRPTRIDQYGADMVDGKWVLGTSLLVFDREGKLRDGQHRLSASMKFGVGFWTLVLYGASEDVVDNIDQGLKRTNSDVLRAHGEVNHHALAAIINVCRAWDMGEIFYPKKTTPSQAKEYLDAHPDLRAAATTASSLSAPPLRMRSSASGALIHRIRKVDAEAAEIFVQQILHGTGLTEEDPAYRYRQWLLTKSVTAYGRPSREMELALGVKCWNAFILGKPLKVLRWARGGVTRTEDFPLILQADGTPYPFPEVAARFNRRSEGDDDE